MKKVILATLFSAAVSFTASASNAPANVKYVGDTHFAPFCKAVINNDVKLFKIALNRFVGELGSSQKRVLNRVLESNSVTCAGQDLVDFAQSRKATAIDSFISTKA
ncbi:MAG: hypothetical protein Alis3KO_12500 [Aliiglaciecola sp.]|uniref:hypothetical protein n=1 Tax=Aliiglaciecola sp. M165 TaxID=2593649 RepID=UPI00118151AA|nr:hypothetical protein [Aliiglaciecola sp. M165]TRY31803.1 hypothetical protein FM019_08125 [Aliiglaciecola sp. M165]